MPKSSNKSKDKIRILLADDHHIVRAGVRQLLEGASDLQAVRDVHEGKSALDPNIIRKLMSNLFKGPETKIVEPLTDRELDVLRLAAKGYTNKAIGMQLSISDRTVQGHLAHIFAKMQASSRTEAVMRAVSLGLISQSTGNISEE
jgi:DNA-binding NarL/FixJ family response regulator